jgi:hypothetical protein
MIPKPEVFRLPPMILHPFSTPEDTSVLLDSSRASLILQGYLPSGAGNEGGTRAEGGAGAKVELEQRLLRGRFAELRMLFYVGKDLLRWLDQCVEVSAAHPEWAAQGMTRPSFALYLVEQAPNPVQQKLEAWGVLDYRALFRRAIGLHSVFSEVPVASCLTAEFLRRYHRHADRWFQAWAQSQPLPAVDWGKFDFDLYASGEYALILEKAWGAGEQTAGEQAV